MSIKQVVKLKKKRFIAFKSDSCNICEGILMISTYYVIVNIMPKRAT